MMTTENAGSVDFGGLSYADFAAVVAAASVEELLAMAPVRTAEEIAILDALEAGEYEEWPAEIAAGFASEAQAEDLELWVEKQGW